MPTSTPTASSTWPSGTPTTPGSTSACAPSRGSSSTSGLSTCVPTSPVTRRCARRSRPSSRARASSAPTPTSGWSWSSGGRTPRGSTRSRWRGPSRSRAAGGRWAAARLGAFGCSRSSAGGCRRPLRDRADVAHEAQRVPLAPGLGDPVALEAIDSDPLDRLTLLVGGLEAHELVLEGPVRPPAGDHLVARCEDVQDLELEIGEGPAVAGDDLLQALSVRVTAHRVVADEVLGAELVEQIDVPLAKDLLRDAPGGGDVVLRHGSPPWVNHCLRNDPTPAGPARQSTRPACREWSPASPPGP